MTTAPAKATPEMYARVFDGLPEGSVILENLVARFGRNPYVPGGLEGDRETCRRAGNREVVDFIVRQINRAAGLNEPEPNDEDEQS